MARCKNDAKFLFCGTHMLQPFAALGVVLATAKGLNEAYKEFSPIYKSSSIGQPWYVGTWVIDFDRSYQEWPLLDRPVSEKHLAEMRAAISTARVEIGPKDGRFYNLIGTNYSASSTKVGTQTKTEQTEIGQGSFEIASADSNELRAKVVSVLPRKIGCPKDITDYPLVMKREKNDVYILGPISMCSSSTGAEASSASERTITTRFYLKPAPK